VRRAETFVLNRVSWFFGRGNILFAPNPELVRLLQERTRRPVFLMERGVDAGQFGPHHRDVRDGPLALGFVGRLMPEKNLRLLKRVEARLLESGLSNFRFVFVGGGDGERAWLQENLRHAEFKGVLRGGDLARAYANFDLFVFPSYTDTFGNVVQEAQASGVPAVVTNRGGPKFLVRDGVTGFIASSEEEFEQRVLELVNDGALRRQMGAAARQCALERSWDRVFDAVYRGYREVLGPD